MACILCPFPGKKVSRLSRWWLVFRVYDCISICTPILTALQKLLSFNSGSKLVFKTICNAHVVFRITLNFTRNISERGRVLSQYSQYVSKFSPQAPVLAVLQQSYCLKQFSYQHMYQKTENIDSHTLGRMYFWKLINKLFPDYTFQLSLTN